jgi:predicted Zn-dependent peptidase
MTARPRVAAVIAMGAALAVAGAATVLYAQMPPAQQPPPPKEAVVLKGKAPVSTEILRVKLPRPQEADLPNGIHLMVLEDRRAPQITMQLLIRGAGGYFDPTDHPGLAMFTAAQMREGTATRTSEQISTELERIAASVTVSAGLSSQDGVVSASCLTEHFGQVLDLAADVLLNPTFPDAELARYKTQQRAQLTQMRSSPAFLAAERFSQVVYGDHPAARVSPTPASLEKTTREALAAFHKAHYAPDFAILAISGDISMAEARKLIEAKLGAWKKAGIARPEVTEPKPIDKPGVFLVARPNSVQTDLTVGTQSITRTSPDYFALTVLNKVIGGGPTGRLFVHLREEKGYTYGAYSNLGALAYRGTWQASTQVRTDVTRPALTDLLDEIRQIREARIPDKEFLDNKRSIVAGFALDLESAQSVLSNYVIRYRYGLPADYWDRYPERIMAVTQDDVLTAGKKYLDPSRLQIVAVGNADAIKEFLGTLGTLEVYDTEGKKIGGN